MSHGNKPDRGRFYAVCRDCGTVKDESFDNRQCKCGGVLHVDSARCLGCGKRHPFGGVGEKCSCGGEIVPKMVGCPSCGSHTTIANLGEYCPKCKVQLVMEG